MPITPPKIYNSIYSYIDAANFENAHKGKVALVTGEKQSEDVQSHEKRSKLNLVPI